MLFEEALAAMREGKKVRYVGANEQWFLHIKECHIVNQEGKEFSLCSTSIVNYDWEIVEEPKWEPEGGDWHVNSLGAINKNAVVKDVRLFGLQRHTKEQAEKARDKMRVFNRLLAYVDEHAPDYVWEEGEPNWYVYYSCCHNKFAVGYNDFCKNISTVYMPHEVAKRLVDDLNSGRVSL